MKNSLALLVAVAWLLHTTAQCAPISLRFEWGQHHPRRSDFVEWGTGRGQSGIRDDDFQKGTNQPLRPQEARSLLQ